MLTLQDLAFQINLESSLHPLEGTRETRWIYGERIRQALKTQRRIFGRLYYSLVKLPGDKNSKEYQARYIVLEKVYNLVELLVFVQLNPDATTANDEIIIAQLLRLRFHPERKGPA